MDSRLDLVIKIIRKTEIRLEMIKFRTNPTCICIYSSLWLSKNVTNWKHRGIPPPKSNLYPILKKLVHSWLISMIEKNSWSKIFTKLEANYPYFQDSDPWPKKKKGIYRNPLLINEALVKWLMQVNYTKIKSVLIYLNNQLENL